LSDDGLGDWRIQAVTTLAQNVPAAYPGGPAHKAGSPLCLVSVTRDQGGALTSFVTPSPTALALSVAANAASQALQLRRTFALRDTVTPWGRGQAIASVAVLYDYFELCMICVAFSFHALEAFCNQTIAGALTGTYRLNRGRDSRDVDSEELQRAASTEEKLATVLPAILKIGSPKGKRVWEQFKKIKDVRDATIHLKAHDAYKRTIDEESLFHRFLHAEVAKFPEYAIDMIGYFQPPGMEARWFKQVRARLFPRPHNSE